MVLPDALSSPTVLGRGQLDIDSGGEQGRQGLRGRGGEEELLLSGLLPRGLDMKHRLW